MCPRGFRRRSLGGHSLGGHSLGGHSLGGRSLGGRSLGYLGMISVHGGYVEPIGRLGPVSYERCRPCTPGLST